MKLKFQATNFNQVPIITIACVCVCVHVLFKNEFKCK